MFAKAGHMREHTHTLTENIRLVFALCIHKCAFSGAASHPTISILLSSKIFTLAYVQPQHHQMRCASRNVNPAAPSDPANSEKQERGECGGGS